MGVGGTQQVISQLVKNLDASRFDCSIACIDGEVGMIGEELQQGGVPFHVFHRTAGFDRELIRQLKALLKEQQIDIIHCHQYTPYVYGAMAALFTGVRIVFTEHGRFYPDRYSWKRRLVNPLLGQMTHAIVAISSATADALGHYEWFSRKSIKVIYNGTAIPAAKANETFRSDVGIDENTLVFGTIARFDEIKNLPMMIDAFKQVHDNHPHTRLLMVGDGDERQMLEQLVEKHNLTDSVIFTGYQSDTASYMAVIDLYLLTSFSEGTSMTLLEAMANETCSIVTAVGGNVELIEHLANGVVVDSGDTNTLAQWMSKLANDPGHRKKLGEQARLTYEQKFSVEQMAAHYAATYDQVSRKR
jgi:glycosyltransferase involved in cell wall biosynthesis